MTLVFNQEENFVRWRKNSQSAIIRDGDLLLSEDSQSLSTFSVANHPRFGQQILTSFVIICLLSSLF